MTVRCAVCVNTGDPMKAAPADVTVAGYSLCAGHLRLMSEHGWDFATALAEIKRNPSRWAL
jgi:hypothetical protein